MIRRIIYHYKHDIAELMNNALREELIRQKNLKCKHERDATNAATVSKVQEINNSYQMLSGEQKDYNEEDKNELNYVSCERESKHEDEND